MTDLRTAAQQALEALDADNSKLWPSEKRTAAITALRAALAEPMQEPQALKDPAEYDDFEAAIRHNERITARRYDSVGPVALETVYETIIHWDEGGGKRSRRELARRIVDIYTAPFQRKPLTEEEIQAAWDSVDMRYPRGNETRIAFARAVERAHGIGGQP